MNKAFPLWLWEDSPSINTPLAKRLLDLINIALSVVDDRVITHETTKANQTDMLTAITNVTFDEKTGKFTFTRHNGTSVVLDTKLEKLILNWRFDSTNQILYLILEDGSEMPINLSAFITNYEFVDSTTIRAVIGTDGKVAFEIIDGTITGNKLEPNYLANIQVEATKASASATSAELSAQNAENSAVRAEKAAEDAQAAVGGDFATNSRVDDIVSGATTVGNADKLDGHDSDYFAKNTDLANYFPLNGSVPMTGNRFSVSYGHGVIYSDANLTAISSYATPNDGTTERGLRTWNKTARADVKTAFAFVDGSTEYIAHHDGNSAKVVKSASAPSDTTAVWIDTANKLVKAYIDGAWTVI